MSKNANPTGRAPSDGAAWLPWLAAAIGLALTLWAFYPGYMSQDSADQYLQARTGQFDTHHPPLMAMIWRLTDHVIPGPGGIFVLFVLMYWAALALVAAHTTRRRWAKVMAVLGIGFWPPMIGLLAHVWKDVGLLAAFLLAGGLLIRESRHPSRVLLLSAFVLIALGAGFRHNGVFAALPFMPWLAARWLRPDGAGERRQAPRVIAVAVLAALVTAAIAQLPDYLPHVQRRSMWPTVALWDLAAVSLEEGRIVIPYSLLRPGLTLQELESNFSPFTNTSTFQTNKILLSLWAPYTATQDYDLRHAWLALPFQHPSAYWRHRWRLTALLFGSGAQGRPPYLVLQPEEQQLADNPTVVPNQSALNRLAMSVLLGLIGTPLFGGWLYLTLAALVLVSSVRRPALGRHALAATIAGSGLCYAVPLSVLSGSADFRYLSWLVGASLIAALLRFGGTPVEPAPGSNGTVSSQAAKKRPSLRHARGSELAEATRRRRNPPRCLEARGYGSVTALLSV